MNIEEQQITGCYVITQGRHQDNRGFLQELYSKQNPINEQDSWAQIAWQVSNKNVLRGIHWCSCGKLLSCIAGKAFYVVVDLRPKSSTFKKWMSWWLEPSQPTQIYVPPMCGNGFFAAEDNTTMIFMQESIWSPNLDQVVLWQDPTIDVKWPAAPEYIMSDRDKGGKLYDYLSVPSR